MFIYTNPHPLNKTVADCVKRAITIAFNLDYNMVSLGLNRHKKVTGATVFNADKNWKSFVNELGVRKISFPAEKGKPRMNVETFCTNYPRGRYILQLANHITTCIDGEIYDTWFPRGKCVYLAFEVLSNSNNNPKPKSWVRL